MYTLGSSLHTDDTTEIFENAYNVVCQHIAAQCADMQDIKI